MLRIDEQPVVTGMSELLSDGGAVRVKEEADLGLAIAKLFLEICASGGGV